MSEQQEQIKENRIVPLVMLFPHERNYRSHPEAQLKKLIASLERFGQGRSIVVQEHSNGSYTIVAGHGIMQAAERLGWKELRADILPEHWTPAQVAGYLVADNQLSVDASDDEALLVELLQEQQDMGFDLASMGSDEESLRQMLESLGDVYLDGGEQEEGYGGDEFDTTPDEGSTRTHVGELWALGEHRLYVGDCTKRENVTRLMQGEKAVVCHADPPYGMGKENEGIANDNLYREKLDVFQMLWWHACRPYLADNSSVYIWGNAEDLWRLWYAGGLNDSERLTIRNEIVWAKGSAGAGGISHMGAEGLRLYPQETERCLFFMLGEQEMSTNADNYWEGWEPIRTYLEQERKIIGWDIPTMKRIVGHSDLSRDHWTSKSQWNFPTRDVYAKMQEAAQGKAFKREYDDLKRGYDDLKREYLSHRAYFDNTHENMTDVWSYPRVQGDERYGHPTPKPVAMIERIMKSSAPDKSLVYEPFLGTGTTLIACQRTDRRCVGMEIEPRYADIVLRRYEAETGQTTTLLERAEEVAHV